MTNGERIRERRKALGMTQEELGRRLGVQKAAISKIENGLVVNLKRSTIVALCQALDCTPSYLMGWDDKESDINEIVDLLSQLSHEELESWKTLLRQLLSKRE